MAATSRSNAELQRKAKQLEKTAKDPVEKLRLACLSRGASGIKGLGRYLYFIVMLFYFPNVKKKDFFKLYLRYKWAHFYLAIFMYSTTLPNFR